MKRYMGWVLSIAVVSILTGAFYSPSFGADKELTTEEIIQQALELIGEKPYDPEKDTRKFKKSLSIGDVRKLEKLFEGAGQDYGLYSYCFEGSGEYGNTVSTREENIFLLLEKANADYQMYRDIKSKYEERYEVGHNHVRRIIILEMNYDWTRMTEVCSDADRKTGMKKNVDNKNYVTQVEKIVLAE